MLETKHLIQPRGKHGWTFRIRTPPALTERITNRTAARRAGVDLRHAQMMGGWSRGNATDTVYDHGLESEQYRQQQQKVARWLREKGYLS